MAYDVARQRVVLFGGLDRIRLSLMDTWEWDGSNWTQRSTSAGSHTSYVMAYDLARHRVVLLGSDTWLYGPVTRATSQPIGNGCPGSNGPPVLTSNDPYLGNPALRLELLSGRASSVCLFGLSTGTQSLPIGPCTLYLRDPITALVAPTNWAGFAESAPFALPLDISLRGATVYAQAFVMDPQGPMLGMAFSQGRRLVLGD